MWVAASVCEDRILLSSVEVQITFEVAHSGHWTVPSAKSREGNGKNCIQLALWRKWMRQENSKAAQTHCVLDMHFWTQKFLIYGSSEITKSLQTFWEKP